MTTHKFKFDEINISYLIAGAVIFGVGCLAGFVSIPLLFKNPTAISTSSSYSQLGDVVKKQSYTVKLNTISKDTAVSQDTKPSSGNEFVNVNITVQNIGADTLSFIPSLQVWVKDESGVSHPFTLTPSAQGVLAGKLLAGDSVKGDLGFEVPSSTKTVKFYFDPGWYNSDPTVFSLNIN